MPKLLSIAIPYLTLYVKEDIQLPVLTPQSMMFRQPNLLSKEGVDSVKDKDLRKCSRYLGRYKNVLWFQWAGELIKTLRERHSLNHNKGGPPIEQGDVVLIIQSDEHNRGKWNIGVVVKLMKGKEGKV